VSRPASRISEALDEARRRLARVRPEDLDGVVVAGGLVIDTRSEVQRRTDGDLPGAIVIERNLLEWRLDPTSPDRIPQVRRGDQVVVVVCNEGYASSLAAASLQDLGLVNATDLAGGFQAWRRTHPAC
jgi:rhodanese-related sulfurtransferase